MNHLSVVSRIAAITKLDDIDEIKDNLIGLIVAMGESRKKPLHGEPESIDSERIRSFIIDEINNSSNITYVPILKRAANQLKVKRIAIEREMASMLSDGVLYIDRNAPRASNRAIIYKVA